MEEIVNGFISEDEENENINEPQSFKASDYELKKIISYFQDKGLLQKEFRCPECEEFMKMEYNKQYIDNYCFRCRSKSPIHDIKVNIRNNSIFSDIKIPINVIYNLLFNCFLKNIGINKSFINNSEFCSKLGLPKTTYNTIVKFFRILREKIRLKYHKNWNETPLGTEPDDTGVSRIEIDESSIIGNEQKVIWMFGLIDRVDKKAKVFCVMTDRRKEKLLPLVKNHVYTPGIEMGNAEFATRIYSDCFRVYQVSDFANMGFLLKKVNHSVWFGQGLFHTNSIEGLWSCIKRISNNFAGLNIKLLNDLENQGVDPQNYLDGWICFCLFIRDLEKNKFTDEQAKIYLIDLLKIN